jgi:transcriptional regulator with XRE-family HTH domain
MFHKSLKYSYNDKYIAFNDYSISGQIWNLAPVNKKIGERIRKFRQFADLSQEFVAEEIGMSGGNFGKIERSEIDVNTETLEKLAKLFKIPIAYFFDERAISGINEKNSNYGYASQSDLDNLTELVKKLAVEVQKIHEKLPAKKASKKKTAR